MGLMFSGSRSESGSASRVAEKLQYDGPIDSDGDTDSDPEGMSRSRGEMMKALINANIYDYHSYKPNSYLLHDEVIRKVGEMSRFNPDEATEVFDCRNALLIPGLILGHSHIYSALVRGIDLPFRPSSFREILDQLWWRFDRGIDLEATHHSAMVSGLEHLRAGVTTMIDHHASGAAIRGTLTRLKRAICDELGLRGVFCFETSDRFAVDECIAENLDFARNESSPYCAGLFGLHASLSLSGETLAKIGKAIGDLPIHVHVAESLEDEEDSLAKYGKRVVRRFQDHGLLNKNSLLAHCVQIDESETEIIAKNGCVIAVNPTSNMNNAVGLPDYRLFKRHDIPVIVGNDSLGANLTRDYLNLLYGMHLKTNSAWAFSHDDLRQCIRNVYDYAGVILGIKIGRLEPGYAADMLALPYYAPTVLHGENIFGHMVNGVFDNFHPREVWCRGEMKLKGFAVLRDEEEIYAKAREAAGRLWRRVGAI